jgi:hypothetical protein
MVAGAGAAFASTLASLRLITMLERSRSLRPYAAYRAVVALGVLAALRRRRRPAPVPSRVAPERPEAVTAPVSG